jgi:hypothetical protein
MSLFLAIAVCVLLLAAFGLFTITPPGRRIAGREHIDGRRLRQ